MKFYIDKLSNKITIVTEEVIETIYINKDIDIPYMQCFTNYKSIGYKELKDCLQRFNKLYDKFELKENKAFFLGFIQTKYFKGIRFVWNNKIYLAHKYDMFEENKIGNYKLLKAYTEFKEILSYNFDLGNWNNCRVVNIINFPDKKIVERYVNLKKKHLKFYN